MHEIVLMGIILPTKRDNNCRSHAVYDAAAVGAISRIDLIGHRQR